MHGTVSKIDSDALHYSLKARSAFWSAVCAVIITPVQVGEPFPLSFIVAAPSHYTSREHKVLVV